MGKNFHKIQQFNLWELLKLFSVHGIIQELLFIVV